ncbi:MAG: EAL domain-containing protein [Spirochaetales bacterium]|nr:EAL domain-containing protein [Spirochaetales bacterium]
MGVSGVKRGDVPGSPVIGMLLDNLFEDYEENIWTAVVKACEEEGVNLICFPGGSLNSPELFHTQRNILYDLVNEDNVDGFIAISGSIGNYIGLEELRSFYKGLPDIPIVSIGVPLRDIPSILVDNAKGMRELLSHIIEVHGRKRIAFISGPRGNSDADLRFQLYKQVLKEYRIPFDPDIVVEGDFDRAAGRKAVVRLLDERKAAFDALVAANDYMALSAMKALGERNIKIPDDVAVAGFDDIDEACGVVPALTTVRQPYDELGRQAVAIILQKLSGRDVPDRIVFPTRLVIRPSCGCRIYRSLEKKYYTLPSGNDESMEDAAPRRLIMELADIMQNSLNGMKEKNVLREWAERIYDALICEKEGFAGESFLDEIEKIIADSTARGIRVQAWHPVFSMLFTRFKKGVNGRDRECILEALWRKTLVFLGLLSENHQVFLRVKNDEANRVIHQLNRELITTFDEDHLKENLEAQLPNLGIRSCFLSVYQNNSNPGGFSRLLFSYQHESSIVFERGLRKFSSVHLVPGGMRNARTRYTAVVLPLYFREEQLGFVLFEPGPIDGIIYETLASEIGSTLKGSALLKAARMEADILETKVKEKTVTLRDANKKLKIEMKERLKTEEALSKQKELALVTLASIADGVITTNTEGIITYMNPIAEVLTGWKHEDALGNPLKKVLNVTYNMSDDFLKDKVEIVLSEDRGLKLSGSILLKSKDGREFTIKESIAPIRTDNSNYGVVIVIHNVSEAHKMSRLIDYHTTHDRLTGLYNRVKFNEVMAELLEHARKKKNEHIFCFLDIDSFRIINDSLGDIAGDELLRRITAIFKQGIRHSDILARLGGDQFGLILDSCPLHRAKLITDALRRNIKDFSFIWKGETFKITVSIGIVTINMSSDDVADIMSSANVACCLAKKNGGNRIHVYSYEDEDLVRYHSELFFLPQISRALEEGRFCLYHQQILPIGKKLNGDRHHSEILIRMKDENGNIIFPQRFIPSAERYNIMPQIDRWVITKLFSSYKLKHWSDLKDSMMKYSINLSGLTLNDDKFLGFVIEQFEKYKVPPFCICFEITENAAILNLAKVTEFMKELKEMGCSFSLDDFGSGWTSFSYLKHFPVDYLKIDGSFVKEIANDPRDFVLVKTINNLGHMMGLQTVAEYVENDIVLEKIREIGVNYAQGYGIAKPKLLVLD